MRAWHHNRSFVRAGDPIWYSSIRVALGVSKRGLIPASPEIPVLPSGRGSADFSTVVAVGRSEPVVDGDQDPPGSANNGALHAPADKREMLRRAIPDDVHVRKHPPGTLEATRLIGEDGAAHCFLDRQTMVRVTEEILVRGEYLGIIRGHERWGLRFLDPIGSRIAGDGTTIQLFYGELKLNLRTGRYHVVPRTRPSTP